MWSPVSGAAPTWSLTHTFDALPVRSAVRLVYKGSRALCSYSSATHAAASLDSLGNGRQVEYIGREVYLLRYHAKRGHPCLYAPYSVTIEVVQTAQACFIGRWWGQHNSGVGGLIPFVA